MAVTAVAAVTTRPYRNRGVGSRRDGGGVRGHTGTDLAAVTVTIASVIAATSAMVLMAAVATVDTSATAMVLMAAVAMVGTSSAVMAWMAAMATTVVTAAASVAAQVPLTAAVSAVVVTAAASVAISVPIVAVVAVAETVSAVPTPAAASLVVALVLTITAVAVVAAVAVTARGLVLVPCPRNKPNYFELNLNWRLREKEFLAISKIRMFFYGTSAPQKKPTRFRFLWLPLDTNCTWYSTAFFTARKRKIFRLSAFAGLATRLASQCRAP